MRYRYFTCDVFTDTRFGGNQLAVLPEAQGLSSEQMQQVAREFNYSETTFVLPPEAGHDRRVRIFTPPREVPFAGHPNIGTAFVLASMGAFGPLDEAVTVAFEEEAGLVPVAIERREEGRIWCELQAPQSLSLGAAVPVEDVAAAVSLAPADILTTVHAPLVASVGLPFVIAEVRDADALQRARPDLAGFERLLAGGADTGDVLLYVHVYARSANDFDIRARMFSPLDGIPEDPATGSANCALAGLLTRLDEAPEGDFTWRIAQGFEMGRPSVLDARTEKRRGEVTGVWISGESVMVSEGFIQV
jgi:trans-2,3-dihydro-3-hydroxyanthranilate isomerase